MIIKQLEFGRNSISTVCAAAYLSPYGDLFVASPSFLECVVYQEYELIAQHLRLFRSKWLIGYLEYARFQADLEMRNLKTGAFHHVTKDSWGIWIDAIYIHMTENYRVVKVLQCDKEIKVKYQAALTKKSLLNAIDRSNTLIKFTVNGTIVSFSTNFVNTLGYSTDMVIMGQHHKIICSDIFYRENANFWQKSVACKVKDSLFQCVGKSANKVLTEAIDNPVFNTDGENVKVVKVTLGVTTSIERQQAIQTVVEVRHSSSVKTAQDSERAALTLKHNLEYSKRTSIAAYWSSELGGQLNSQSVEIFKIVAVIKSIVDQPNLLALKAAREAACAGQQGRGFALVAECVRMH